MLLILEGEAHSIRIKTPGDDGTEFQLQREDTLEHWQVKRQITGQDTWSRQKLKPEGILTFFFEKFKLGESCVFESISDSPDLRILIENAVASASFEKLKKHFLDKKRSKLLADLTKPLAAATEEETSGFLV
ncbi:MAG: hypothetical protein AB8F34_16090 [Akkermansiaceae bacterium]